MTKAEFLLWVLWYGVLFALGFLIMVTNGT